jgi:hypothetical protein
VRLVPSTLRGSWGFFADEPPKLELATWRAETVQVRSTLPKPASVMGKPASSGDGIRHRCRIWQRNGGNLFTNAIKISA